jgi:hypothetical protein
MVKVISDFLICHANSGTGRIMKWVSKMIQPIGETFTQP